MKTKHIGVLDHPIMSVPISLLSYGSDTGHLLEGDGPDPSLTAQAGLFRRDPGRRGCLKGDAGRPRVIPSTNAAQFCPARTAGHSGTGRRL